MQKRELLVNEFDEIRARTILLQMLASPFKLRKILPNIQKERTFEDIPHCQQFSLKEISIL